MLRELWPPSQNRQTLPPRRRVYTENRTLPLGEPVAEVPSESTGLDGLVEIDVGRAHDANVDRTFGGASDTTDPAFLKHP